MGNTVNSRFDRTTTMEDIPENNGLIFMERFIPEEIFFRIFCYVPAKELLCNVSRVCQNWRNILQQNSFWLSRLENDGIRLRSTFRSQLLNQTNKEEVLKCLQNISINQPFKRNLILNPSGKDGFKYWQIRNSGDGIRVEESPCGANPIPEEARLPSQHCFVASYGECQRIQEVDLRFFGIRPWVMNVLKPRITASEWVCARWDCDSWTELTLILLRHSEVVNKKTVRWSSRDEGIVNRQWYKIQVEINDYPEGVTSIKYHSRGKDHQFWAGHYGTKSAGSSIHLHL